MPAAPTPKPPPFWLPLILPGVAGLESNPLYLRLSGRAYSRPPAFLRARKLEGFARPPTTFFSGIGLPLSLWFGSMILNMILVPFAPVPPAGRPTAPPIWYLAALMVLGFGTTVGFFWTIARAVSLGRVNGVAIFIQNAARLQWGESLHLSLLRREEIDDAVLAALVEREARGLAKGVAILATLPAAIVFIIAGLNGNNVIRWALVYAAWAIPIFPAAFGWLFALQLLNLAQQAQVALDGLRGAWGQRIASGIGHTFLFFLAHAAGCIAAAMFIGFAANGWQYRPRIASESAEIWLAWQIGIALFIYPSALIILGFCRIIFRSARGRIGEALAESVQRGRGE